MRGAHPTTDNDNHKIPLSSGHRISTILAPDSQRTFFPLFTAFQFVGLGDQRITPKRQTSEPFINAPNFQYMPTAVFSPVLHGRSIHRVPEAVN